MEFSDIMTMIGNGFFPIVCCGIMFWQNGKLQETLQKMSETMVLLTEKIADIERKIDMGGIDDGK